MTVKERQRRAKVRIINKLSTRWQEGHRAGHAKGMAEGEKAATEKARADLRNAERRANIEYAEALAKLMNSVCQASCAFFGEGGLRG